MITAITIHNTVFLDDNIIHRVMVIRSDKVTWAPGLRDCSYTAFFGSTTLPCTLCSLASIDASVSTVVWVTNPNPLECIWISHHTVGGGTEAFKVSHFSYEFTVIDTTAIEASLPTDSSLQQHKP
ncbi:hypothetical protein STEG23_017299 [Scotinomys teguina]